jgi:hypothetical protein
MPGTAAAWSARRERAHRQQRGQAAGVGMALGVERAPSDAALPGKTDEPQSRRPPPPPPKSRRNPRPQSVSPLRKKNNLCRAWQNKPGRRSSSPSMPPAWLASSTPPVHLRRWLAILAAHLCWPSLDAPPLPRPRPLGTPPPHKVRIHPLLPILHLEAGYRCGFFRFSAQRTS